MKKSTMGILWLIMMSVIISCGQSKPKDALELYAEVDKNLVPNTLSSSEKKEGWKLLFDGKTTDGWHGYNMKTFPDSWAIEDGSLTMNTTGAAESQDIITNKEYRDFALTLEYKLTRGANSGVIFQVAEDPKYKFPYETGPEFQIIDDTNWPDPLADWQINGANYAMYPPIAKPAKSLGDWNQLMLVVKGNMVTQIINGVVVVKYEKYSDEWKKLRNSGKWAQFPDWGKFDQGYISLQNHGTKVWYRSIKIKLL
jgi:3-keto-disaccharide hydrolase